MIVDLISSSFWTMVAIKSMAHALYLSFVGWLRISKVYNNGGLCVFTVINTVKCGNPFYRGVVTDNAPDVRHVYPTCGNRVVRDRWMAHLLPTCSRKPKHSHFLKNEPIYLLILEGTFWLSFYTITGIFYLIV